MFLCVHCVWKLCFRLKLYSHVKDSFSFLVLSFFLSLCGGRWGEGFLTVKKCNMLQLLFYCNVIGQRIWSNSNKSLVGFLFNATGFHMQAVEKGAGMDGQKILYSLIKHRLGDLFYRLV